MVGGLWGQIMRVDPLLMWAGLCVDYWGWDKMAAIFQMTFWNAFFFMKMLKISIAISLKLVSQGPVINISALIQIMAWCQPRNKSSSESMIFYWDKMAAIFQMTFSNASFLIKMHKISMTISLKFVSDGPVINISAFIQIMAWCQPRNKPLSESVILYWYIIASPSLNDLKQPR